MLVPISVDRLATCLTTTSGGSIGGPIIKDKIFIFGDYLRTSDHESVGSTFTIPDSRYITNAGHTKGCTDPVGCIDLSGAFNGTKGQIYDPATGAGKATHRTPFPKTSFHSAA